MSNDARLKAAGVTFDFERPERIGLPEAVFSEGKPLTSLSALFVAMASRHAPILFTRLREPVFAALREMHPDLAHRFDYDPLSATGWFAACPSLPEASRLTVGIVCAGTSDLAVTREAGRTLQYLGHTVRYFDDCGVAGLWRFERALPALKTCDIVIVVAGLDAALASVLGGLLSQPLIAVPTSVGYGVAHGGETALHSMLASCAPGITVMNIDNGYGAACAAARMAALGRRTNQQGGHDDV